MSKKQFLHCVFLLLLSVFVQLNAQNGKDYRLTKDILPSNYKIRLEPYLEESDGEQRFTFDGEVLITLSTQQSDLTEIALHSKNLNYSSITLIEKDDEDAAIIETSESLDDVTDIMTLELSQALKPNTNYSLNFIYVGLLSVEMHGFYRSSYVEGGVTKWAATTQMEATYARHAFPCFDEPSFKATFDLTIIRPASFSPTVANTAIISSQLNHTKMEETFAQTPKMSTYLVAFIVSELRLRENAEKTFGVLARPDAYDQTKYAFEIGPLLLAQLSKWMDYDYYSVAGITKLYMAAMPDFDAGAMENWGLVIYRETSLLYDPLDSDAFAQQRVATVIAHEQAHLWFGDLVTTEWWSNLWLNEGFATFFEFFGTALVEPTWDMELQFVTHVLHVAFSADSSKTSKPLTSEVYTPSEISDRFSSISYKKGGSVLRMIEHAVGKQHFKTSLQKYLKSQQLATATPKALFATLSVQLPDISDFMETWTNQAGYPVVHVKRVGPNRLQLRQERFFENKNYEDKNNSLWQIPITYATSNNTELFQSTSVQLYLLEKEATFHVKDSEWVIFNVQQTGFYRVNYETEHWLKIRMALSGPHFSNIHVLNRAQIVSDLMSLAYAEQVDYKIALNVVQYMENETHYTPWHAFISSFKSIIYRFSADIQNQFKKYFIRLSHNVVEKLTFSEKPSDTRLDIYNRAVLLRYLCKYGEKKCVSAANAEFEKLKNNPDYKVPVNFRPAVYCTVIANGDQHVWDFFWDKSLEVNVASEKSVIYDALSCTKSARTLIGYMDKIVGEQIRLQDKTGVFMSLGVGKPEHVQTLLDYVLNNYQIIVESLEGNVGHAANIIANVASLVTSREHIDQLKQFVENMPEHSSNARLTNAIEGAEAHMEWSLKNAATFQQHFQLYGHV